MIAIDASPSSSTAIRPASPNAVLVATRRTSDGLSEDTSQPVAAAGPVTAGGAAGTATARRATITRSSPSDIVSGRRPTPVCRSRPSAAPTAPERSPSPPVQ